MTITKTSDSSFPLKDFFYHGSDFIFNKIQKISNRCSLTHEDLNQLEILTKDLSGIIEASTDGRNYLVFKKQFIVAAIDTDAPYRHYLYQNYFDELNSLYEKIGCNIRFRWLDDHSKLSSVDTYKQIEDGILSFNFDDDIIDDIIFNCKEFTDGEYSVLSNNESYLVVIEDKILKRISKNDS